MNPAMDAAVTRVGDILTAVEKLAIDIGDTSDIATAQALAEGVLSLAERAQQVLDEGAAPERLLTTWAPSGTETENGADAVVALLRTVGAIGNETLEQAGRRDYMRMADAIGQALQANVFEGGEDQRHGFLLALADLLCVNADGAGVRPDGWEPLTRICSEQEGGAS